MPRQPAARLLKKMKMTDVKTREAAAIAAALLLARLAQLRFAREPDAPMPPFGNCLRSTAAHLLLVPSVAPVRSDNAAIGAAADQLGYDALVMRVVGSGCRCSGPSGTRR